MNNSLNYVCPKCGSKKFKTGTIRTEGRLMRKIIYKQNFFFSAVICDNCQYTEFYNMHISRLRELFNISKEE